MTKNKVSIACQFSDLKVGDKFSVRYATPYFGKKSDKTKGDFHAWEEDWLKHGICVVVESKNLLATNQHGATTKFPAHYPVWPE